MNSRDLILSERFIQFHAGWCIHMLQHNASNLNDHNRSCILMVLSTRKFVVWISLWTIFNVLEASSSCRRETWYFIKILLKRLLLWWWWSKKSSRILHSSTSISRAWQLAFHGPSWEGLSPVASVSRASATAASPWDLHTWDPVSVSAFHTSPKASPLSTFSSTLCGLTFVHFLSHDRKSALLLLGVLSTWLHPREI